MVFLLSYWHTLLPQLVGHKKQVNFFHSLFPVSLQHGKLHTSKSISKGIDLRILPFGDSITFGEGSTDGNGYRLALSNLLTQNGKKHKYIGSVQAGTMTNNDNEGHGGFQIVAVGLTGKPDYALRPNVVLLMAGTNDIVFDNEIVQAPSRLGDLVEEIAAACPDAAVLVGTLVPLLNPGWASMIADFNSAVPGIITDIADKGKKVGLVDMGRVTTTYINPSDGIHPTDDGYEKIAEAWFDGILAASEKGWIEEPLPGVSQNTSTELNEGEVSIIESQPDRKPIPPSSSQDWKPNRINSQFLLYLAILGILAVSAHKAAGMVLRRYRR